MDEAAAGIDYLETLSGSAWLRHQCSGCGEIQSAAEQAVTAIESYLDTLRQEVAPRAKGALGCGERHFRCLLERRHFVDIPLASLRRYLEALFRDTFRQLELVAEGAGVAGEPGFVLTYLLQQRSHVGDARLRVYREESNRLRDFLHDRQLVGLPEQPFRIIERPVCPHPGLCDSGYLQEADRNGGIFFISGDERGQDIPGEPRCFIVAHCIRQGWVGAHLLAFSGTGRAREHPRRLAPTEAFGSAWRLYFRQYLLEAGYYGLEDRLLHVLEQLQALGLALLDLDLNTGAVGSAQALERLEALQLDPQRASHLLVGLGRRPTEALAGCVGWLLLHQAREVLQHAGELAVGEFHDQLLGQGPVPPSLLIPHLFGTRTWSAVRAELLV
jgi:hypothetical protein